MMYPLLLFTDLFLYWCFKCRCSHTAAQMGKHVDVFTREFFYDDENIWLCFKSCFLSLFFFVFFSPSVSPQQSREWSSHPCKGVSAWRCVCVCVCVIVCERWRSSTLASILAKDVGVSQTPVADGSSRPDLKEQTQLRLSNTKITARKQTKMKKKYKKKDCLQGKSLFRLCTPRCFYRRTATPTSRLSTDTGSVFIWRDSIFFPLEWLLICFCFF